MQSDFVLWRLQVWAQWPVMSSGARRPATEFTNFTASQGATAHCKPPDTSKATSQLGQHSSAADSLEEVEE